jgi:hypothetical protein
MLKSPTRKSPTMAWCGIRRLKACVITKAPEILAIQDCRGLL